MAAGVALIALPITLLALVVPLPIGMAGDGPSPSTAPVQNSVKVVAVSPAIVVQPAGVPSKEELVARAKQNPSILWRLGRERYERDVKAYRCSLFKQELLPDGLTDLQEIEVRYRVSPETVFMIWRKNESNVRRAMWIDDPAFIDSDGQRLARVEPAGAIIRIFTTDVKMPITGGIAAKSSRRSIKDCNFGNSFMLLEHYHKLAAERGVLDEKFVGTGTIDGRPTFITERHLPYEGDGKVFPDAKQIVHFDQELLLPIAMYSYADHAGKKLLGSYVFTRIELNPKFDESAFRF